jgi:hypothetical protein
MYYKNLKYKAKMTAYRFLTSKTTTVTNILQHSTPQNPGKTARGAVLLFLPLMAALAYFVARHSCTQPKNV